MPELAEDLINEISEEVLDLSCEYKGLETDEDGRFEGYASVFGNKDLGNDVIEKGAFLKSIHRKRNYSFFFRSSYANICQSSFFFQTILTFFINRFLMREKSFFPTR